MQRLAFERIGEFNSESPGLLVIEFETLHDVIAARDAVEEISPDEDAEPLAFLDAVVASERRGYGHCWPVTLVGAEAALVVSAELRHAAAA